LGDYYLDPLKVVGLEGMWGVIYYIIALPILQHIHCTNAALCPFGVVEDSKFALKQYQSKLLTSS